MSVLTWLIYDIVKDNTRTKVAKECKKAGLIRVQKSVLLDQLELYQRVAIYWFTCFYIVIMNQIVL